MSVGSTIVRKELSGTPRTQNWFYAGMALVALLLALVGFGPAAIDPASRKAPLNIWVGLHGALFSAWLLLFLLQSFLVARGNRDLHRRIGYAGIILAIVMVCSGYFTAITMTRRGYDLSGDLINGVNDPLALLVFQLGDLVDFSLLVGAAIWFRRRSAVHKRLMLLAIIGGLMPAALTHIIGHSLVLREINAPIILIPLVLLYSTLFVHDRLTLGRIHSVTKWGVFILLVWANLRAAIIGPSQIWHNFAAWLIR